MVSNLPTSVAVFLIHHVNLRPSFLWLYSFVGTFLCFEDLLLQGGPPILPQDPVGDWLDLGEDYRLQLQVCVFEKLSGFLSAFGFSKSQVNTNQYGRTFEDRSRPKCSEET